MDYDKLLLATGGNARTPSWIKGIDAKNVYNIRNHNDQEAIKKKCAEVKDGIAIIGASFIGSEAAAAIKGKYKDEFAVHVIGLEKYPLQNVLGNEIGSMMADEHTKNGVVLHMATDISEVTKNDKGEVC